MAGKDTNIIDKILSPSQKSSKTAEFYNKNANGNLDTFEDWSNSFIKTIDKYTRKMYSTDCTDAVIKYIDSISAGKASGFLTTAENILNKANIGTVMKSVGNLPPKWTELPCTLMSKYSNLIIELIDAFLSIATKLFKKIDNFRRKLELAITFFLDEVRDCLMKIIVDVKKAINFTYKSVTNFSMLAEVLDNCPCLKQIFKKMFPMCKSYTSGIDILNCISQNFTINGSEILGAINQFIEKYVVDSVFNVFKVLDVQIRRMLEVLMIPFRWLVKKYCKELNRKYPMIWLKFMGDMRCFFIYTKKKNGQYTMSILDMIKTLKYWVGCFDAICGTFSDDIKRKIKEYNESLRLEFKHWSGPHEMDIYWSCMATRNEITDISDLVKKEIWTRSYRNPFKEIQDWIKDMKEYFSKDDKQPENVPIEEKYNVENPLLENIKNENGSDNEQFPLKEGYKSYYSKEVSNSITKIIQNLGSVMHQGNYSELLNEFMKWCFSFIKDQNQIDAIKNALENSTISDNSDIGDFESSTRYGVLPTYVLVDDYTLLNAVTKPTIEPNETSINYYERWFKTEIANS